MQPFKDKNGNVNEDISRQVVDLIMSGEFDAATKKSGKAFGASQIARLARAARVTPEELRFGKALTPDERSQSIKLRSRKLGSMAQDSGFRNLSELFERSIWACSGGRR